MNTLGHVKFFRRDVKIEYAQIRPGFHDRKAVEQRNFMLHCNPAHCLRIGAEIDHGFRAWAVLCIHQHNVGASTARKEDPCFDRIAEPVGIRALHGVDGAGLPNHEPGL